MSASGTPDQRRARFIGFAADGRKLFAYACGNTICDNRIMQGRHVGFWNRTPLYATSGECFKRLGVQYMDDPCGVARRVSTILKVRFRLLTTSNCFDDNLCPQAEITFDQHTGGWSGSMDIGGHTSTVSMECAPSGVGFDYILRIANFCSGIMPAAASIPLVLSCDFPLRASGEAPHVVPINCCGNLATDTVLIAADVTSLQKPRYIARFVGFVDRKKLFAIADCCPPPTACTQSVPCCGCEVSPAQWTFDISGIGDVTPPTCPTGCDGYNGSWTLTRLGTDVCAWEVSTPFVCTPAPPWTLVCLPEQGVWALSSSNFGGAFRYERAIEDWDCLGPNEMTKTADHGACTGAPGTVTVTPV